MRERGFVCARTARFQHNPSCFWHHSHSWHAVFAQSAHFLRFHLYSSCAQGPRDTPSARAAQLGPQTLVNLFNSPLYSDVIFMVQGGS